MFIYGLANCDTCRKARKALPDAKFVDVRADGIPDAVLEAAFEALGDQLLNTRSTTWRGLSEDERSGAPLALIKAHPALMKRPLFEKEGTYLLGWTAANQAALGA